MKNSMESQGYGFPVVMYGCESWTVKKAESQRIDALGLLNAGDFPRNNCDPPDILGPPLMDEGCHRWGKPSAVLAVSMCA